jgi:hypothetical protein
MINSQQRSNTQSASAIALLEHACVEAATEQYFGKPPENQALAAAMPRFSARAVSESRLLPTALTPPLGQTRQTLEPPPSFEIAGSSIHCAFQVSR